MAKITGTVKWFSNRKGFGFLAPTSENAPTTDEIFVHHSSLQMVDGAYRTLAEGTEVEFEVETDDEGRMKAMNVTGVGGEPLVPPPRENRRPRKAKAGEKEVTDEENEKTEKPEPKKTVDKKGSTPVRDPPFHQVIPADLKAKIEEKGVKLVRNTVDVSFNDSRIKLGQGGYASIVGATGVVGEGTYTCDDKGKVDFKWERSLEFSNKEWEKGDISKLLEGLSLVDDDIQAVQPDETPETLWGKETTDPKDKFADNGFKMKRVILTRPRNVRSQGGKRD